MVLKFTYNSNSLLMSHNSENTSYPISSTDGGELDDTISALAKAKLPTFLNLESLWKDIKLRQKHLSNADSPISSRDGGKSIDLISVVINAAGPIFFKFESFLKLIDLRMLP